ncbi:MAG TPA: VWA domain-containing protein [Terriglobales bacterium]|nr:VWA domain-containing protein [Terriglobales bacterium]
MIGSGHRDSGRAVGIWVLLAAMCGPGSARAAQANPATVSPAANNPTPANPGSNNPLPVGSAPVASSSLPPAGAASTGQSASEISSRDEMTTFKVRVNLVLLRVVVRDANGHAVGNLHKEDFQLFDNRKPQMISHFAVEQPGSQARKKGGSNGENESATTAAPERYLAYAFDDVHLESGDLTRVRDAADRHIAAFEPEDRGAIFTTSGRGNVDFTDDKAQLRAALRALQPRPVARVTPGNCPEITFYMADLIENKNDAVAYQTATMEALSCRFNNDKTSLGQAQQLVESTARMELQTGEAESRLALTTFYDVIRRVAEMPGQRTILLFSPGFLVPEMQWDYDQLIDRAVRAQITISALNARGLYTVDPMGDVSQDAQITSALVGQRAQFASASAVAEEEVLYALSNGTGGTYFHNNNDLDAGLRQIATAPEYFYVLGFAPQNLKLDGSFHNLKVTLKDSPPLAIQARKGYYAPRHAADPAEEARQEIEEALFSREELHDLPVQLHTQFFKANDLDAKLAVLVHVDVKQLHFRKQEGRNRNDLTIVSGLFDRNGRFVTSSEKVVEMRLKDDTLAHKLGSGITLKTSFDVRPGSYLLRLVVRDAEGQLAATNGAVEIP